MNIRGAIFDLDGTLTDSMYIWQKAPVDLMRRYGGPEATGGFAPGADRLLARLADSDISCCIATASEAFQARSAMERLGLWPHFRFAVSCVQYGGKTRPDIYLEAARRLGTAPAETVVFEDALHAARTAHEAGFRVCGVWDASAEEDQAALKALADWYVRDLGDWVP